METLTNLVNSYYPEPHASLFNGMLLGKQLFVTNTFYNQLKQVGLIHIVVLSGMNITMLSAIVLNTLVYFINRKWALLCTIVIIILFVLFVGAEPPIIRAAIMGIISIGAVLYGRKTMALYSLFLSAIIMLIFNFEWLQSISFQLSFSATLGIVLFGSMEPVDVIPAIPPVIPAIPPVIPAKAGISRSPTHRQLAVLEDDKHCHSEFISESLQEKILKQVQDDKESLQDDKFIILKSKFLHLKSYFIEELRISFAAQVFTVPLIFWYFRQVSMVSPLANILVAWLIAPIMILGMITIALGFVSWKLGFVFSWLVYPLLAFIVWVVEVLAKVPFGSIKV